MSMLKNVRNVASKPSSTKQQGNLSLVQIVEAVKAVQRIPKPQQRLVTYFSLYDHWLFDARADHKVCLQCQLLETIGTFNGNVLRLWFPNLTILDVNTIAGPAPDDTGLVHPNCRCHLKRELNP